MNIRWPSDLQPYIDEMLAGGAYESVEELILHALYLHRDAELDRRRKYEELRRDVLVGVEQLDRGESLPGPEVFERLRQRLQEREKPPT
jgi:antitoxin ParD1/3/4